MEAKIVQSEYHGHASKIAAEFLEKCFTHFIAVGGDGTIPYISLMWAHTWLLHATRAMRMVNSTTSMLVGERISNPKESVSGLVSGNHAEKV